MNAVTTDSTLFLEVFALRFQELTFINDADSLDVNTYEDKGLLKDWIEERIYELGYEAGESDTWLDKNQTLKEELTILDNLGINAIGQYRQGFINAQEKIERDNVLKKQWEN
jgi:hypothetical protein